ncbi:DsbC family protein [Candidatus Parabeggiatoa sp. HSG14]|uniref:DsbC family protein n=1 Tax=Candidatus Parabeggiatoa sp. HSG14 TaxID=3055593 RepID=UPI0025A77C01|nr:DsbC family protein [Thiotrichales bacterium HSG14]
MRIYLMLALFVINLAVLAAEEIPNSVTDGLKRVLKTDFDKVSSITPTPIAGLYEVMIGSQVIYVSADGNYLVLGEIQDTVTGKNLTDEKRNELRKQAINALSDSEMVVFVPEKDTKHTINVFTDVDCQYCAKFHQEVSKLNEDGVKVRYLAFPRAGIGSKTYKTMRSVWCASNRQQAMTDAKSRREIKEEKCNNPIKKQYELGQRLGVTGTPALVLSDGTLVPGYLPAERLIFFLENPEYLDRIRR